MENQHRQIKGYRELEQNEIDLMNEAKELAAKVGEFCGKLAAMPPTQKRAPGETTLPDQIDMRWLAIGQTKLQLGFMAVTRSIAKPGFF